MKPNGRNVLHLDSSSSHSVELSEQAGAQDLPQPSLAAADRQTRPSGPLQRTRPSRGRCHRSRLARVRRHCSHPTQREMETYMAETRAWRRGLSGRPCVGVTEAGRARGPVAGCRGPAGRAGEDGGRAREHRAGGRATTAACRRTRRPAGGRGRVGGRPARAAREPVRAAAGAGGRSRSARGGCRRETRSWSGVAGGARARHLC
jgi:hypothetical protein